MTLKNSPVNGTSANVGRVGWITRSSSWGWSGSMRPSLGGGKGLPVHAQRQIFLVGAVRPWKPLFSRAVRTVAWDPVTGCGCRFRAACLSIGWKNARSKVGLHNLAPVGGPEFAIGRKHAVIPMPVPPRRRDKIREPVEELER